MNGWFTQACSSLDDWLQCLVIGCMCERAIADLTPRIGLLKILSACSFASDEWLQQIGALHWQRLLCSFWWPLRHCPEHYGELRLSWGKGLHFWDRISKWNANHWLQVGCSTNSSIRIHPRNKAGVSLVHLLYLYDFNSPPEAKLQEKRLASFLFSVTVHNKWKGCLHAALSCWWISGLAIWGQQHVWSHNHTI